jgi:RHS repeat-associated protein
MPTVAWRRRPAALTIGIIATNDATLETYGYDPTGWRIWKENVNQTDIYIRQGEQVIYQETIPGEATADSTADTKRTFVYLGSELAGTIENGSANYYVNNHLGTTELITDEAGEVTAKVVHSPYGDAVKVRTTLRKTKAALDTAELIDAANTTATINNGQAIPAKGEKAVEQLLYSSDAAVSTEESHYLRANEYIYEHNNSNIMQLKVVATLTYADVTEPVQQVKYIDLADQPLGNYRIALDIRKDVGSTVATTSQKFEVYVSKIRDYVQSQVQTTAIDLPGNTTAFTLKPEGTALEKVTWAYSGDGGENWTEIDVNAEDDTVIKDAPSNLIIRATLTPDGDELPTVTGFDLALLSVTGNSRNYFFTGKEKDASGLYYFGARYYDPEVGRFISEDPGRDGVNWYGYCDGNPVNYVDPDGRISYLANSEGKYGWYIDAGDTLKSISAELGLSRRCIATLNRNMDFNNLEAGVRINIPQINRIEAFQWATRQIGSSKYGFEVANGNYGENTWKCTLFVGDAYIKKLVWTRARKEYNY